RCYARDVEEARRHIERQMKELARQAEELRDTQQRAQAANRAKGQFLANMTHEIRTPLNGILGMTELLLDTTLTAEQRDYLATVRSSADSLLAVINDILDFSKIEANKLSIDPINFDVRDALHRTLKPLAMAAHGKGLELTCHVPADLPEFVVGD